MADQKGTTKKSSRHPLGATPDAEGVNFSIFSYDAKGVELLLFDKPNDLEPTHIIPLDPAVNTTFFFWHIYVSGLRDPARTTLTEWMVQGRIAKERMVKVHWHWATGSTKTRCSSTPTPKETRMPCGTASLLAGRMTT